MLGAFAPRQHANLAHAFAVVGVGHPSLFDGMVLAAAPGLGEFDGQNFANVAWAYAKLGHPSPGLFDAIAREAAPRLGEFEARELANLAWLFSKFPSLASSGAIFDRIAEEVVCRGLDGFSAQGLAMLAHSFATVGHVRSRRGRRNNQAAASPLLRRSQRRRGRRPSLRRVAAEPNHHDIPADGGGVPGCHEVVREMCNRQAE